MSENDKEITPGKNDTGSEQGILTDWDEISELAEIPQMPDLSELAEFAEFETIAKTSEIPKAEAEEELRLEAEEEEELEEKRKASNHSFFVGKKKVEKNRREKKHSRDDSSSDDSLKNGNDSSDSGEKPAITGDPAPAVAAEAPGEGRIPEETAPVSNEDGEGDGKAPISGFLTDVSGEVPVSTRKSAAADKDIPGKKSPGRRGDLSRRNTGRIIRKANIHKDEPTDRGDDETVTEREIAADRETADELVPSVRSSRGFEVDKLSFRLMIIAASVALVLSLVHFLTKDRIDRNLNAADNAARSELFVTAGSFVRLDISGLPGISKSVRAIYAARAEETSDNVGYCVNVTVSGYGGDINMIVGVSNSVTVNGVVVTESSETVGNWLSALSAGGNLISSLVNASASSIYSVEVVSGATVTSQAVIDGVADALGAVAELLSTGEMYE